MIRSFVFVFLSSVAFGQGGNMLMLQFAGVPTGHCAFLQMARDNLTSDIYSCTVAGAWQKLGPGSGGGTPGTPIYSVQTNDPLGAFAGNAAFISNFTAITVPSAPTLTKVGAGTGTTWGYIVVAGLSGASPVALGSPSMAATISGNATLDGTHSITVTPPACASGVLSFDVYRTSAPSFSLFGLIGNVACGVALSDTGLAVIQPFGFQPTLDYSQGTVSTLPYVNTSTGSAFGCAAYANNGNFGVNNAASNALGVFTRTSCAGGGLQAFGSDVVADAANIGISNTILVSEIWADSSNGGYILHSFLTDNGNTRTVNSEIYQLGRFESNLVQTTGAQEIDGVYTVMNLGTITHQTYGSFVSVAGQSIPDVYGYWTRVQVNTVANQQTAFYDASVCSSTKHCFGFYQVAQDGGSPAEAYPIWLDEAGVLVVHAINTFDSVYQARLALYNPLFTKYTAGAADYERITIGQWSTNVAQIGTEKGGTGTLRQVQEIGNGWILVPVTFSALAALANGTQEHCSDCTVTSSIDDTCAGSGSGAVAERVGSAWKC